MFKESGQQWERLIKMVNMLAIADNRQEEIKRILDERQVMNREKGE